MLNPLEFVFQGLSVAFKMLNACFFFFSLNIITFKSFKYPIYSMVIKVLISNSE